MASSKQVERRVPDLPFSMPMAWACAQKGGQSGFSSKSEYTRAQLEASASTKESFFARKMEVSTRARVFTALCDAVRCCSADVYHSR